MLRALTVFVVLLLGAGTYVLLTGGAAAGAATPSMQAAGTTSGQFGFALAAGAVALGAVLMVSRPRGRFRR